MWFELVLCKTQPDILWTSCLCFQINHTQEMKKNRVKAGETVMMSNALIMSNVTMEDKGTYVCIGSIEDKNRHYSTKVTVYGEDVVLCHYLNTLVLLLKSWMHFLNFCLFVSTEHPFLNVTHSKRRFISTIEGRKVQFEPRVNALPAPDKVLW